MFLVHHDMRKCRIENEAWLLNFIFPEYEDWNVLNKLSSICRQSFREESFLYIFWGISGKLQILFRKSHWSSGDQVDGLPPVLNIVYRLLKTRRVILVPKGTEHIWGVGLFGHGSRWRNHHDVTKCVVIEKFEKWWNFYIFRNFLDNSAGVWNLNVRVSLERKFKFNRI